MSDLQVEPCVIREIKPHPQADRLEICIVKGWEVISGIDNYSVGDIVVHIPPDSLVPQEWADKWEVTKYLSWNKRFPGKGRVRAAKLRGIVSYGFLVPNDSQAKVGTDLKEHYGIDKWEPPPPRNYGGPNSGKAHKQHPLFHQYTKIQNIKNYPDVLEDGELVQISEKIHGCNCRLGLLRKEYSGPWQWLKSLWWNLTKDTHELAVGTHRIQRNLDDCGDFGIGLQDHSGIEKMFKAVVYQHYNLVDITTIHSIILHGEIYGASLQDLKYNTPDKVKFRAFDISINGKYVNYGVFSDLCERFMIPTVPLLYKGPYSLSVVEQLYTGKTTLGGDHMREGIVIKPLREREDPKLGRVIVKAINPDYLCRKDGTENH